MEAAYSRTSCTSRPQQCKGLDADEESAAMDGGEGRRSSRAEIKINKRLRGPSSGREPSQGRQADLI
jgi:hypothetical protein